MGKLTVNTIEDNGNNTIVTADGLGDVTVRANTIDTVTGTSSLTLGGTNATSITLGSGASFSNVSGQNYPAFRVVKTSDQTTTDNLITKITWDVEEYDTDNTFASNTFTVPSGQAGKYYIESSIFIEAVAGDGELSRTVAYIYKNGSIEVSTFLDFRNSPGRKISTIISSVLDLSAGDYIEIYGFGDTVSGGDVDIRGTTSLTETYFQGFRIGD